MPIFASIDIGSNAIRCAVGSLNDEGRYQSLFTARRAERLGTDVFSKNEISQKTASRACDAIKELFEETARFKPEKLRTVATSAVRDAINQEQFLELIKERTTVDVEVITGIEEARLIYLAVGNKLQLSGHLAVLLDIGGGSVEVSLSQGKDLLVCESVPLGAVRLLPLFKRAGGERLVKKFIEQTAERILSQVTEDVRSNKITEIIGTGGNIEALADLRAKIFKGKDNSEIKIKELKEIISLLNETSVEDRITKLGLREDRADVIYPASLVVHHIASHLNVDTIIVPHIGLREGVLIELLEANKSESQIPTTIFEQANKIAKKYKLNFSHANAVRKYSANLFDSLQELHTLSKKYRPLLELGAFLHDIGQFISIKGHHKHSYAIITATSFPGLSEDDKQIVAALARYHRKAPPSLKHEEYAKLKAKDRDAVLKLTAILRIADALDRSHETKVSDFTLSKKQDRYKLEVQGDKDLSMELWALDKKKDLFEDVFKVKFEVEARE